MCLSPASSAWASKRLLSPVWNLGWQESALPTPQLRAGGRAGPGAGPGAAAHPSPAHTSVQSTSAWALAAGAVWPIQRQRAKLALRSLIASKQYRLTER